MSLHLKLLKIYLRLIEKPWLARVSEPADARAGFERSARLFRNPPFSNYLPATLGGVPGLWVSCRPHGEGVLLFLHGGAYVMGSSTTHRAMLARLAAMTGARAFLPDYRLAPEHPYPAALDDAWAVWRGLLARGYAADRIVLGGDSAGGGLMLALLSRICADGGPLPACAFAFSPWTDMTLSGGSLAANAAADPLLPVGRITEARGFYLAGADPADPGASPLLADFTDAPPVMLQAARTEILFDDTARMADALIAQGVPVTTDIWDDAPHVWQIFQGWLPEADTALSRVAAFIERVLRAPPADDS